MRLCYTLERVSVEQHALLALPEITDDAFGGAVR